MKKKNIFKRLVFITGIFLAVLAVNNNLYATEWPAKFDEQPSYGSFVYRGNEYIMSDEALSQAKDNIGKNDLFDERLNDEYPGYTGQEYLKFMGNHSNTMCSHWYSGPTVRW